MPETGPFVLTLRRRGATRIRAVATLEEAQVLAGRWVDRCEPFGGAPFGPWAHARTVARELSGAAVVGLPDGVSTIDLRDVTWSLLCAAVGSGGSSQDPTVWKPEIIAAYNLQREREEEGAHA